MEAQKAAFMGKIVAGATHEIKNVLAIIKESAGLLEDLISLTKEDSPPPRDKLLRTITRITDQVARGVDLATKLNSFAHTPDEEVASVDLNQVVAQTSFLSQRFARLKSMTLHAVPNENSCTVAADPLALQMLLFQCVALLMDLTETGGAITVQVKNDSDKRVIIAVTQEPQGACKTCAQFPADSPMWTSIQNAAESLKLLVEAGGPPVAISVGFPGTR
jgi:signal transduction histidine kinase